MTYKISIFSISLLLSFAFCAAQAPAPPQPYHLNHSAATVAVIILVFIFFILLCFIYLNICSAAPNNTLLNAVSLKRRAGLDDAVIASFPVFCYAEVKELKIGKNALECAICLNEFDDEDVLRLVPVCDHVFHPECIDAWLEQHITCPVCRGNLVPGPDKTQTESCHDRENGLTADAESISVTMVPQEVTNNDLVSTQAPVPDRSLINRRPNIFGKISGSQLGQTQDQGTTTGFFGKFPRSHSTGHSLVVVLPGDNTERFTLRLPDHVRREIMTRALTRTATFSITEGSSRRGKRTGDGSSRGARSYKRLDRAVKSDRWVITVPFFSSNGKGDGEGSVGKAVRTAVKLPSFKCLEPSASGDVAGVSSVRPVV